MKMLIDRLFKENKKPTLAFVSPLPPLRTGAADYSAELLPELSKYYEIELITDQTDIELKPSLKSLKQRSVNWFSLNGQDYDRIILESLRKGKTVRKKSSKSDFIGRKL